MKYDFDTLHNRRGTNSLKWDVKDNELPMWVADMDFMTAPAVTAAIKARAESGIFGYNIIPEEWYQSIINWWNKRHNIIIERKWLIFTTGVIPAITCAVNRLTNVGDNVVIQTPVYDIFFHSVENHGRHVIENKLLYDYDSHMYSIDYDDLEIKLSNPLTTLMILCNPHNPAGRVWSREELARIGELCNKYNVVVVSDEIHCDITEPGISYIPFASVSDICRLNSITCISATKAFNIAGLQTAAVYTASDRLYAVMERGLNSYEVAEPNCFAIDSVIAALTQGEEWLEAMCEYVSQNRLFAQEYINKYIPKLDVVSSEATYLMWIECSAILKENENSDDLCEFIRNNTGLYITSGKVYRGDSDTYVRINLACPRHTVETGLNMLRTGIKLYGDR